ncbi:chorismate mutase [Bartonella sp. WD16.2]|uniref:chorismate mutase n=1 Tax=Bartonella sp. WD16.2 TaxID=1933904 RepID=UPI0009C3C4FC|nr:chorismate mutase [Bartonella sp. WD16.2]AQX20499.1 chorismate mutase [Bartonella sp. WD16.2]
MQKKIQDDLTRLRASIDDFGTTLVRILAKCFCCIQAVGELKARYALPIVYVTCEQSQVTGLRQLVMDNCLNPNFAERFLNFTIRSDSSYNYC